MATATVNPALILSGPGILYNAPLGTAVPAMTVAASKFPVTAWGGAWVPLGATDEGSEFSDSIETDNIEVAESYYPVKIVTTGREASWTTALAEINKTNVKTSINGGTITSSGTGATSLTEIEPPAIGAEVRTMLGWQSEDDTVRFVGFQVLQVGDLSVAFRKGADKATLAIEWKMEKPTASQPWKMYLAGADRAL